MREFQLTVRQTVEKFCKRMPDGNYDFSNVSLSVRNLFIEGQTENWVDIIHLIMPNDFYDAKNSDSEEKNICRFTTNTDC